VDKRILAILFWVISLPLFGQEIVPHGNFLKDSVKIGEELPYSLWIKYPKNNDVAFPDSLFDFSPFELEKRHYFTTKSDSLVSLDSVVYYFTTFEIDTVQYLTLPVYLINEYDSTTLYTSTDSIILKQVVTTLPDSVAVLVNTDYQKVPLAFNYPYFTIGIIIILIIALVIFLVFGKRIRKTLKVYWLTKRHKQFINSFNNLLADQPIEVERTLSAWKKYLENLLSQPYTKLTSKEIVSLTGHSEIAEHLKVIDRYIYSGSKTTDTKSSFEYLMLFSVEQFNNRTKEIQNG
jgi:Sec-independent protein translocase protein TatA